ncbi:benzoate/H(+) symporter BenE family transporter [Zafaria sp. J156]|uniref:benzoate/H(+) symporter BenE family transporter n=1 Tax=Zafaria sp. J156 TaxID=3116490 RepID=UPI002E794C80|nr:benzoate/H(+) symporter BenE family transporter [Zafaria sp. J156]MEE1620135.1 benzoate/H(+) symporter BenE family transporter [Zafaria sp. J156]
MTLSRARGAHAADRDPGRGRLVQPLGAGLVTALVGFSSSFAVVLAGLRAVGATPGQAASGLLALTLSFGVITILLAVTTRQPITLAWSTPGAALLAAAGGLGLGWDEAVGGFLACAGLIALTGAVPALGRLVGSIPVPLAQAMLAGVLFELCLAPVHALADVPLLAAPVVLAWLAMMRWAPRWAVPVAMAVTLAVVLAGPAAGALPDAGGLVPRLEFTAPAFSAASFAGIAVPLFIVTMASQNVPGVAVLTGLGYRPPWSATMLATGAGSAAAALFGGHAVNLAAISAALAAGEEAGPERNRRWIAAASAGGFYLLLGLGSAAVAAVATAAPPGLLAAAAGLALLGTLGSAASSALADPRHRLGALTTFLVTASGLAVAGIGAAFWGLLAGLAVRLLLERRDA